MSICEYMELQQENRLVTAEACNQLSLLDASPRTKEALASGITLHLDEFNNSKLENIDAVLEPIAKLSGYDGAVVLTKELEVIGFGAKISVKKEPERIRVFEHYGAAQERSMSLEELGGTRHQSATKFVADNPDCIAFALSQDRGVTLFFWNAEHQSVIVVKNIQWLI